MCMAGFAPSYTGMKKWTAWAGFGPASPCGFDTTPSRTHGMSSQPVTQKCWRCRLWAGFAPGSPCGFDTTTPERMTWAPNQWLGNGENVHCELVLSRVHLVLSTPGRQSTWHELPTNDPGMEKMCIVSWFCPRFTLWFQHQVPRAHDMSSEPITWEGENYALFKPMTQE